eukprot:CAMPEP_0114599994 /NCGR_PEP_ID=MMETSP0125-20121206/22489_1 /TAXON_ID=485358 ORGANISM="Aristerostoma sp., Strain ATCC 50986" /NCGR_SAMPLE_ID=MMETSP0125 /ASSEMBLY_ACC=CAM_ASM_000245 /LENGTH=197 /DNA_ID=CAMNT_0001807531 /DNA_START=1230 /DNA_END=1822 /DNA_ORIENTATION=+
MILGFTYLTMEMNFASLGVANYANTNLALAPIADIDIINSDQDCPDDFQKTSLGYWPGLDGGVDEAQDISSWKDYKNVMTDTFYAAKTFVLMNLSSALSSNLGFTESTSFEDNVTYTEFGGAFLRMERYHDARKLVSIEFTIGDEKPCVSSPMRFDQEDGVQNVPYYMDNVFAYGCVFGAEKDQVHLDSQNESDLYS